MPKLSRPENTIPSQDVFASDWDSGWAANTRVMDLASPVGGT